MGTNEPPHVSDQRNWELEVEKGRVRAELKLEWESRFQRQTFIDTAATTLMASLQFELELVAFERADWAYDLAEALWEERERRRNPTTTE